MYKFIIRFFALMQLLFISSISFAQQVDVDEETGMRTNGKIFVVVAVCITILFGLIVYLVNIDRKIGKLEDKDL